MDNVYKVFDCAFFESNLTGQLDEEALFIVTAKNEYLRHTGYFISLDDMNLFLNNFCDRSRGRPSCWGDYTQAPDSKYVFVETDMVYLNGGKLRYVLSDLIVMHRGGWTQRVFNSFWSAR